MIPGSSRTEIILFENLDVVNRTITFHCETELCEYLTLPSKPLELPIKREIEESIKFSINLPDDIDEKAYLINIIGTDDTGRKNVLSIQVNVGNFGFLSELLLKLSLKKKISYVSVPYWLIGIFSVIIFGVIIFFAGLKKVPGGFAFAFVGGLVGSFILLLLI